VSLLGEQLAYLEASSPFYAERLRGVRAEVRDAGDLPRLPFTTKEELRDGQRADPPFGHHLCAPRERLVRMHVTSGTTGEPVAVGFTRADHEANSAVGGEAFRIAGLRPDDVVAHCLNYALYAGGIADHMALEASGATVVPVGTGQSRRLLELIPQLGITAIFGTLSFPA
jgi:phenylacetate-CoA ligase